MCTINSQPGSPGSPTAYRLPIEDVPEPSCWPVPASRSKRARRASRLGSARALLLVHDGFVVLRATVPWPIVETRIQATNLAVAGRLRSREPIAGEEMGSGAPERQQLAFDHPRREELGVLDQGEP
jgi:hypothetical protein